jgi:hypothetical protein
MPRIVLRREKLRSAEELGGCRFFLKLRDSSADVDPTPSVCIFILAVPLIKESAEHAAKVI